MFSQLCSSLSSTGASQFLYATQLATFDPLPSFPPTDSVLLVIGCLVFAHRLVGFAIYEFVLNRVLCSTCPCYFIRGRYSGLRYFNTGLHLSVLYFPRRTFDRFLPFFLIDILAYMNVRNFRDFC